ncbi:MAG: D-alanyl-D-alanine dipeptidase [Flavobacteriaceae bacterium]|jgi:D-alanyl-D-alanine dipeptidase
MKAKMLVILIGSIFFYSCDSDEPVQSTPEVIVEAVEKPVIVEIDTSVQQSLRYFNLVDILSIDSTIQVELKYATDDNFMGFVLYDTLNSVFLQQDVAVRVAGCQQFLKDSFPNYSLLIYDGVRPVDVQRQMWDALDSIPPAARGKFVSNPWYGSVHNFGAAVDITLCNELGVPLDMGAEYDDFRDIAFPSKEWKFLNSGELTKEQHENRKLLRAVMKSQGFRNIPSEWWHFNACSRDQAVYKYKKLMFESGIRDQ